MSEILTTDGVHYANRAREARARYLQYQAAAWIILNDQYQGSNGPCERASAIADASMVLCYEFYWTSSLDQVGKFLAAARGNSTRPSGTIMELNDEIIKNTPLTEILVERLEAYVDYEKYWNTYLERILAQAASELKTYNNFMTQAVNSAKDGYTPGEIDFALSEFSLIPRSLCIGKVSPATNEHGTKWRKTMFRVLDTVLGRRI